MRRVAVFVGRDEGGRSQYLLRLMRCAHELCQWLQRTSRRRCREGAREQRRELRGGKRLTANMSGESPSRLLSASMLVKERNQPDNYRFRHTKTHISSDASYVGTGIRKMTDFASGLQTCRHTLKFWLLGCASPFVKSYTF